MEIVIFLILVGMFFLDHRLAKLVKIEREILDEMKRQYAEKKREASTEFTELSE